MYMFEALSNLKLGLFQFDLLKDEKEIIGQSIFKLLMILVVF